MQNCCNIKYHLATDRQLVTLIPTFDERFLCCICIPDSSTLLHDKAKVVVYSCEWITSSPVLANVRERCSRYGCGCANLHLAGISSCMQLYHISSTQPSVAGQEASHTLEGSGNTEGYLSSMKLSRGHLTNL